MAALDHEERLMILFADVHYFFAPPGPRPVGDRFDRGSYLYLYGNRSGRGARLEIANNAATPSQDAFTGVLDQATIRYSHKHPTLCTITAHAFRTAQPQTSSPGPQSAGPHWQLPNFNPMVQQFVPQQLHTVDVYFWTTQDTDQFMNHAKRLLQPYQIELPDQPRPLAQRDAAAVSPVIQQLEKAAIQDPSYGASRTSSSSGVPVTAGRQQSSPVQSDPSAYQPLAYNPAAPPAPETIQPREKTPPPVDAGTGTGLSSAIQADSVNPSQMTASSGYVPQIPSNIPSAVTPIGAVEAGRTQSVSSLPPPPPLSPPNGVSATGQLATTPGAGQQYPAGGVQREASTHQPMHHVQPQYADYLSSTGHQSTGPIGGFSNYSYSQQQQSQAQQQAPSTEDYSIHTQLYRPTEEEASRDPRYKDTVPTKPARQPTGKFDEQAGRVDKGVNRFFKKIEKKIG